jgi:hypothetical protein
LVLAAGRPTIRIDDQVSFQESRIAFGPEALSRFTLILEEVMVDLIGDGVPAALVRSIEVRTRLSQRLLGFARLWWTDNQIKQLLLRALRNEISAGKYAGVQAAAESVQQGAPGRSAIRSACLGVDKSEAVWRKPVRVPEPET